MSSSHLETCALTGTSRLQIIDIVYRLHQPRTRLFSALPPVRWEKTIELVDIECVLGDILGAFDEDDFALFPAFGL